jgi:hypothetical protein
MGDIRAPSGEAKCFDTARSMRRPDGVRRPGGGPDAVIKDGRDGTRPGRRRYRCHGCRTRSDDPSGATFAGHHQPLRARILCPYPMGLDPSNGRIARGSGLDPGDARVMASQLREGIADRRPEVTLGGELECDEACVVAGHEGPPEAVRRQGEPAAADA